MTAWIWCCLGFMRISHHKMFDDTIKPELITTASCTLRIQKEEKLGGKATDTQDYWDINYMNKADFALFLHRPLVCLCLKRTSSILAMQQLHCSQLLNAFRPSIDLHRSHTFPWVIGAQCRVTSSTGRWNETWNLKIHFMSYLHFMYILMQPVWTGELLKSELV